MFYFLLPALASYNIVLVVAAVIPALFLMLRAYKSDRLEKEPPSLLWRLAIAGVLSSLIALVVERVLGLVLNAAVAQDSKLYDVLLYFVVVAFGEEGAKYFMLKRRTWRSPEFNCQYDGVVYALFVSLGFALWENISYVMAYGFSTALIRALTAIPGHACFGVFMGAFYGMAKRRANESDASGSKALRVLAVLVPALLHGTYDYIASTDGSIWGFIGFIVVLFIVSFVLIGRMAKNDRYI
ncbi:MAG: PrsW family intramembrane metalloprotease [Oscillospiraceae bacterium]|nr:PrsW family intramembrane metalloprotease [Oscillospiraceae bacterium]